MASHVCERGERRRRDGKVLMAKPVEPVGQVDRVRRGDQHENRERYVAQPRSGISR